MLHAQPVGDHLEIRRYLLSRLPGPEASEYQVVVPLVRGIELQLSGHDEAAVAQGSERESKTRRHDADDGDWLPIHEDCLADDPRIRREPGTPERVTEHHDRGAARPVLVRRERATEHGRGPDDAKEVAGDAETPDRLAPTRLADLAVDDAVRR